MAKSKFKNLDTDTTLGGNNTSDEVIASQKAIKSYTDNGLSGKQATLVSGTNIKTINNESILGSGNITISGGGTSTDVQVNGTSITSNGVANLVTNTAYNSSSNKIATMSDIPADEIFVVTYNVTTFPEASQALEGDGKQLVFYKPSYKQNCYSLNYKLITESNARFVFYLTNNNTIEEYTLSISNGWSSSTTNIGTVTSVNNVSPVNGNVTLSIPDAQVQANWNETNTSSKAYIQNKPTIPDAQIQSDWNQTTTTAKDYIKNKPTIPTVPTNVSAFTNDAGYVTTDHTYPFNGITFYSTDGTTSSITRDCNQILNNGLFYYTSNGPSGLGEQSTDGALYVQAYSTSWVVQIAQDYRTGNLFTRSKNNGSWTAWKAVGGSAITITYDV